MKTVDLLEKEILALSDEQRFELFERVSASIVSATPVGEEADSISEAIRRDKELRDNPSIGVTWEQIKSNLGRS